MRWFVWSYFMQIVINSSVFYDKCEHEKRKIVQVKKVN